MSEYCISCEATTKERDSLLHLLATERDAFGKRESELKAQIDKSTCNECEGTCGNHALDCPESTFGLKVDCINLQQEINCLRMEPCQLPRCVALKARAERMEKALRDIANYPEMYAVSPEGHMRFIAKSALSEDGGSK